MDLLDLEGHKDHLDPLVALATMDPLERVDLKDHLALVATLADADPLDLLDPVLNLLPTPQETKDHPDLRDHEAMEDHLETMDRQDSLVEMDRLDLRDLLAHKETPDPTVVLESLGSQDLKGTVEFVRNTAPWMVEFSSKMEPGDRFRASWHFSLFAFIFYPALVVIDKRKP